jgi:hypothetical protein
VGIIWKLRVFNGYFFNRALLSSYWLRIGLATVLSMARHNFFRRTYGALGEKYGQQFIIDLHDAIRITF